MYQETQTSSTRNSKGWRIVEYSHLRDHMPTFDLSQNSGADSHGFTDAVFDLLQTSRHSANSEGLIR